MKIYTVIRETYEDEILKGYLIEKVFTNYKKAEYYQRYSQAWADNNDLSPYVWKYQIKEFKPETFNWKESAEKEENKESR